MCASSVAYGIPRGDAFRPDGLMLPLRSVSHERRSQAEGAKEMKDARGAGDAV